MSAIGLLHPGEMGAAVGAVLTSSGEKVFWCRPGRSAETIARAEAAGLEAVDDLHELVRRCDRLLSVCPPHAAEAVSEQVARAGFRGLFVDANAIAPGLARGIADRLDGTGIDFVDGGLVGPPPTAPGRTRLHLSGDRAVEVASWFRDSLVEAIVLQGGPGAASALKMAYAGWTKGTTALLAAVWTSARAEGVGDALLEEWRRSIPELEGRLRGLPGVGRKAWRFEGEMRQIAETLAASDLPRGFHHAAAEIYRRLAPLKDAEAPPLDQIVETLTGPESAE